MKVISIMIANNEILNMQYPKETHPDIYSAFYEYGKLILVKT